MLELYLAAIISVILFYIFFPCIGAYLVRRRWFFFRTRVFEASRLPMLSYSLLRNSPQGNVGQFKLFGTLQAMQGNDTIWVEGNGVSLRIKLAKIEAYTLSGDFFSGLAGGEQAPEDFTAKETLFALSRNRMFSIPEGTRLLVAGNLFLDEGNAWFQEFQGQKPVLIFYDGDKEPVFLRTIWAARHKNEFANSITLFSVLAGVLLLAMLSYLGFYQGRTFQEIWFLPISAMMPLLVFLPPGVLFFELYRHNWRKGRRLRADRDLFKLVLGYKQENKNGPPEKTALQKQESGDASFLNTFVLPDNAAEAYEVIAGKAKATVVLSWAFFVIDVVLNFIVFAFLFHYFLA